MLTTNCVVGDPTLPDAPNDRRKAYVFRMLPTSDFTTTLALAHDGSGDLPMRVRVFDANFGVDDGNEVGDTGPGGGPDVENPTVIVSLLNGQVYFVVVECNLDDGSGGFATGRSFTITRTDP